MTPTKSNSSIHPFVGESTRQGRANIQALLDQPGQCLRDDVDKLDFKQMEQKDLSDIDSPGVGEDDSWMLVDTAEKMHQCCRELEEGRPTEIGLDMEMYNPSKFTQVTCLLQLSSNAGKEYVIDTLAPGVWDCVSLLSPLFADPAIVKVGHSIGSLDIRSLHRDFGIFVVNAFDTYEAAQVLKLPNGLGLAWVCQHYGLVNVEQYKDLKAMYQTTDWRRRPLTDDMIRYGRYDVHFLLALRRLMIRDLTREELWDNVGFNRDAERRMIAKALASSIKRMEREEDGEIVDHENDLDLSMDESVHTIASNISDDEGYFTPPMQEDPNNDATRHSEYNAETLRMQANLMRVISHSQQRCLDLWSLKTEVPTKNDSFVSVIYRAGNGELEWSPSHMALYEDLVHWRDVVARKECVLPGLVCSLHLLVSVAAKRPTCEASLRRISYFLPELLQEEDYLGQILSLVRSALEKDGTSPASVRARKYSVPGSKSTLRKRHLARSLAAVAVIGAVTVLTIALSRRRRR
jgi:ribonuclease D